MQMNNSSLFGQLPKESQNILENFDSLLQDIQSLNTKQLHFLPQDIRELSHQLTDQRGTRRLSYMNEKRFLSAYTRYFMWWNLVRLTSIFSSLDEKAFQNLTDGSYACDFGTGPLTLITALWLSRPELWEKKITWYTMDLSSSIMSLGEEIFLRVVSKIIALTGNDKIEPWKIIRIKGTLGTPLKNKITFATCANVFNEMYEDSPKPLEQNCKIYTDSLLKYLDTNSNSSIFIAEPGIPRSARFISLARNCFLRKNFQIVSPCPQSEGCPMEGKKGGKWCHFVLPGSVAPKKLQKLSEDSGLPKDRASISFVFVNSKNDSSMKNGSFSKDEKSSVPIRIVSDSINLNGISNSKFVKKGRYACSKFGLTLFVEKMHEKNPSSISSGSLVNLTLTEKEIKNLQTDRKSGAIILYEK